MAASSTQQLAAAIEALQALLLGGDDAVDSSSSAQDDDPLRARLREMLAACLADPAAAASELLAAGRTSALAPCLLSSLEQGYDEAGQLLLLPLLLAAHGAGSAAPTPAWPGVVTTRLAALVARSGSSQQADGRGVAVIAARLLAAAAASRSTSAPPEPVLSLLHQAAQAAASVTTATAADTAATWPFSLGPDGIEALATLAASCAAGMDTTGETSKAVAGTTDCPGWSPQQAAALLLALAQAVEHQPSAAAAVSGTASADWLSGRLPSSSLSGRHQHLVQQLHMLVQLGAPRCAAAPQAAGGGSAEPCLRVCCLAQLSVLRSLTGLVLAAPSCAASPDLLRGVLGLLRQVTRVSPRVAAPTLDAAGRQAGYQLMPTAAPPCNQAQSATPKATACWLEHEGAALRDSWLHACGLREPGTLLEAVLLLLLAAAEAGGSQAAGELYHADVSSCLEQLCAFVAPGVAPLLASLYRCLCVHSSQLRDEVMQDANMTALVALIAGTADAASPEARLRAGSRAASVASHTPASRHMAVPLRVHAAAMSRLSSVLDAACGADFLAFTGSGHMHHKAPAGRGDSTASSGCGLAAVVQLLLRCMQAQLAGEAPLTAAGSSPAQEQLKRQLLDSTRQAFLAALGRARQMQRLTRGQLPRGGFWTQLDGAALRALEHWCLGLHTIAGARGSDSSSPPAAESPVVPAVPGPAAAAVADGAPAPRAGAAGGSKRRAGGAAAGRTVAGRNAASEAAGGGGSPARGAVRLAAIAEAEPLDEDGLRVVWSSGPSADVQAARAVWRQLRLSECLEWSQSSTDLEVKLLLPADTRKQDVVVSITPDRLTVRVGWAGRVLDGPLKQRIKPSEACWSIGSTDADLGSITRGRASKNSGAAGAAGVSAPLTGRVALTELLLVLPKEEGGRYWRALFEGGEEKSHIEVLQEALASEDDARHGPTVDSLGPEAALLLEELRERQELMASGQWSLENSFDDFRLVLGDNLM